MVIPSSFHPEKWEFTALWNSAHENTVEIFVWRVETDLHSSPYSGMNSLPQS